jgi:hypothetical protein
MDFRPAPGQEKPGLGPVVALSAWQLAAGIAVGVLGALLPGGGRGLSAVAPIAGALGYGSWAEGKSPGCLSPRLTRRLALWAAVVSVAISLPFVIWVVAAGADAGVVMPATFMTVAVLIAAVLDFLITWAGLVQGRKIAERARRKSGGA